MASEERLRLDLVPDEGGPEVVKDMADRFARASEIDRQNLVRQDKARLEVLARNLVKLDGFPKVKVLKGINWTEELPLLLISDFGVQDLCGVSGRELYLEPDGNLTIYDWERGIETESVAKIAPLPDEQYLQFGQQAIKVVGARLKEVAAVQAARA